MIKSLLPPVRDEKAQRIAGAVVASATGWLYVYEVTARVAFTIDNTVELMVIITRADGHNHVWRIVDFALDDPEVLVIGIRTMYYSVLGIAPDA